MEIFNGTDDIIDNWLGLGQIGQPPQYQHRTSFLRLLNRPAHVALNGRELVYNLLTAMNANWVQAHPAGNADRPSIENWRFDKHTEIAQANVSRETRLERVIALLTSADWANQIPIASGLCGDVGHIDLARRDGSEYWLFELKVTSNNPLSAAIQMLRYGTLYLFWRQHRDQLIHNLEQQPVLSAQTIHLRVLAPRAYYNTDQPGSLLWLETALSDGIATVAHDQGATMDFRFDAFSEPFYEALYR